MTEKPSFEFSGGALCLDFANTLGDRPWCDQESLREAGDVLRWCEHAGTLDRGALGRLRRRVEASPALARRLVGLSHELRERIFRIFAALAAGRSPDGADIDGLNRDLARVLGHLRVREAGPGFTWGWSGEDERVDGPLWPVIRSAAELLTSDEAVYLRQCASERCSWLFVDRSRTRRRRWCDMKTCGNREKARRHYRRSKRRR